MNQYWELTKNGIRRNGAVPFSDHIEMAGHQLAAIVTYGTSERGELLLNRELCYPQLRTLPRDTFGTLHAHHPSEQQVSFVLNGTPISEKPIDFSFDGILGIVTTDPDNKLQIMRHCFPCVREAAYMELVSVKNISECELTVNAAAVDYTDYVRGAAGVYVLQAKCPSVETILLPGDQITLSLVFSARMLLDPDTLPDADTALIERQELVKTLTDDSLVLECPDEELCRFFAFAKLRAAESIFDTHEGPLHSPGGGPYYAAIWANDQLEYAAPFFPFLDYPRANEASYNAFRLFARFMAPTGTPIPSSIIDEGRDFWEGHGDRGDAAMYLYGCSRYLLAMGDRPLAERMFWTLRWSINFVLNKKTSEGVIASDSDELEERLPSGDANLCTSSLVYGGLISSSYLAEELGFPELAAEWKKEASDLYEAIESYFGDTVSGFETYRYYDGNTCLRSWICIPLTVGIYDRQKGCTDALLSNKLFCDDGVLSAEGDEIIWDRSTLYAFRGILNAGESDRVYPYLQRYVSQRLIGPHVPYAVEAYPEGNQRHLSAESALFARIVTEGLCGITPVGLHKLEIRPSVPKALGHLTLKRIRAGGSYFDLDITRTEPGHYVKAITNGIETSFFIPWGQSWVLSLT